MICRYVNKIFKKEKLVPLKFMVQNYYMSLDKLQVRVCCSHIYELQAISNKLFFTSYLLSLYNTFRSYTFFFFFHFRDTSRLQHCPEQENICIKFNVRDELFAKKKKLIQILVSNTKLDILELEKK